MKQDLFDATHSCCHGKLYFKSFKYERVYILIVELMYTRQHSLIEQLYFFSM